MSLNEDFKTWAEDNDVNLDDSKDFEDWYHCWAHGFNTAIRDYSIWKDGVRRIGCMEEDAKDAYIEEGF